MKQILTLIALCVFNTQLHAQVSFVLSSSPAVGSSPRSVTAADVNGDGKVDLINANWSTNTLSVLTNNGSGAFVAAGTNAVVNRTSSATAADVNGDGKLDLINANFADNTLSVLTNNGSGGFVLAGTYVVGADPVGVVVADVNGDGKIDLVSANKADNTLSVLTNNGSGAFVTAGTYGVGSNPWMATAADVNGDGKVDLISANSGTNTLSVLTNNGSGDFVTAGTYAVGINPFVPVAADVNGDGKVDLISANYGTNTLSVLTNATPFPSPVSILAQPASLVVPAYAPASFGIVASGAPPISYQWAHNGTNLTGATSNTFNITHVRLSDLGNYQVFVSNDYSSTNSDIVTLSMSPSLTSPFIGATPIWGRSAVLSVGAIGSGELSYQWYKDGVAIDGATTATLNFASVQFTNGGFYSVVVGSPFGIITNVAAQVAVNPAGVSLGFCPALTINGVASYSYVIQGSTNLTDTNAWVTLTNLTLSQPIELWVDTSVDASSPFNSKVFYRVLPAQ